MTIPALLSIGELAERSATAQTALRYYDELGLVRPVSRVSGRRRYAESSVRDVSAVKLFQEVGFSLTEIRVLLRDGSRKSSHDLVARKIEEIGELQDRLEVARQALEHGQRCPAEAPTRCPRFWAIVEGRADGLSLEESHRRSHAVPRASADETA